MVVYGGCLSLDHILRLGLEVERTSVWCRGCWRFVDFVDFVVAVCETDFGRSERAQATRVVATEDIVSLVNRTRTQRVHRWG